MSAKINYTSAVSFIILLAVIFWNFNSLMPKQITNLNSPKTEFSTERALIHLKKITQKPHYVGSENHSEVRNYIIAELEKLGLRVEVQTQTAVNKKWRAGTKVRNILAKIKGTEKGKALLLLSHYDSSPHSSLGASDAGSGVVTILEGIRAYLENNSTPKNDIIILISDAEELGLLGANAFVNHHPWAKDIGLVLNFEARGSGGPSYMLMETNGGNRNLVKAFNKAHPKYPVANSLLYSIYKMLPNDTDLTIFREDGNINGFNFAFLDDHFDYHTAQDSYNRLDKKTLQHQAEYLMPLLSYFSDADLTNLTAEEDHVFFNFPGLPAGKTGFVLIHYPFSWVIPMLITAVFAFLILIVIGLKQQILSIKNIFIGFIPFLIALISSGLLAFFGWKIILKIYPDYNGIVHGFTYNGHFYITTFIALTIWITLWTYSKYFNTNTISNLFIAPIFIWLLINVAVAIYLPGAGFLIIPVFIALIILVILLFSKSKYSNKVLLFSFIVIPVLIIFTPLVQMFPIGLGLKMTAISTSLTVLIIGILLPIFASYTHVNKISKLFLLIGLLSLVSASFTSNYTEDKKRPNSILYVLDVDKKEAFWVSYDVKVDEFTQQYLSKNPDHGSFIKNPTTSKYGTNFKLFKETKVLDLDAPDIKVLLDTIIDDNRIINFKITPQRGVNRIEILSENVLHFSAFTINGDILKMKKGEKYVLSTEKRKQVLSYYFTKNNESLELKFSIPKDETPNFEILEASYDLFTNPLINTITGKLNSRSETMMPMPFVLNDAVVIKKKIEL